jgi:hypothetical protein
MKNKGNHPTPLLHSILRIYSKPSEELSQKAAAMNNNKLNQISSGVEGIPIKPFGTPF